MDEPKGPRSDRHEARLDRYFERVERELPSSVSGWFRRLWHPSAVWVRFPLGLAFIVGGFFGFLPILGFWMIPLGLILVARDIPFLRRPIARMLVGIERRWQRWRRRRSRTAEDR